MTADTATAEQSSVSKGLGALGKAIYIFFVLFVAFILYKGFYRPDDPGNTLWWTLVMGWLLLGCLGFILFVLGPRMRRFALFAFLFLTLLVLFGAFIQGQLTTNLSISQAVRNSGLLTFLLGGFADTVIWSLVLGLLVALIVIGLPLLVIAYAASVYVLALHEVEGVSRWDAMRYVIALMLGNNLPFIEIENGQALITKEGGKINVMGGPGELIIKHGNVVALERGGKIIRVLSAGVHKLKPLEKIRNIFVLSPESNSATIEHVLTKDRIPLSITLGIKVQIEPASEVDKRPESRMAPHGEGLTEKLDDGLYQVYEGTIRKAALMSQATSFAKREHKKCDEKQVCQDVEETTWNKVAASLPEGELRDHIMSHRFDELFELVDSAPGEKPEVRVDKRKIYEIEQAILEEIKPTRIKVLGILVRGVDIGKIEFPEGAEQVLLERWGAPWQQQSELDIADLKVQALLAEAHGRLEIAEMEAKAGITRSELETEARAARAELDAKAKAARAELEAQAMVILARAKAQARILEGQGEGEARAAFFREVLKEIKKERRVLDDSAMLRLVLQQLVNTIVSVEDLEAFVKATASVERMSRRYLAPGSEEQQVHRLEAGIEEPGSNGTDTAQNSANQ